MKSLIHEIHRRSVWQVLGIYLAGSWVALQVIETFSESMTLPDWVMPLVWVLLVAGLPMVLATAIVQEGGPGRRSGEPPPSPAERGEEPGPPPATATSPDPASVQRPRESGVHRLFTWRNSIAGGVLAFALIGVVTVGWIALRAAGLGPAATLVAQGVLEDRAPVILADFASAPGDSLLARAATEALRVDLAQSRVITVVEQAQIAGALSRMDRPADTRLDVDLAREIAVREGSQAVIAGEIIPAGNGFVLSARVVSSGEGQDLVSHRETARDEDAILTAIDDLSRKLRERIGESLTDLRADEPLARVTTSSLEALRKYSQAVWATDALGDTERGIALLEEAVALDTAFAMAWRKLGTQLGNRFEQRARQIEAISNAYRFRDRLTELERYWAAGSYFTFVEFEPEDAITAYRNILEIKPDDYRALNNLGNRYRNVLDLERAREVYERAIAIDSFNLITYNNLAYTLYELDRPEEAMRVLDAGKRQFPENPGVAGAALEISVALGDDARADDENAVIEEAGVSSLFWRATAKNYAAMIAARRGRLAEATRRFDEELEAQRGRGLGELYINSAIGRAWVDVGVRGDRGRARARIEDAVSRYPLERMDPLDRPYLPLAQFYAVTGEPGRARELFEEREAVVAADLQGGAPMTMVPLTEGILAAAEGRVDAALEAFDRINPGLCGLCGLFEKAEVLDRAGRSGEAIAAYEAYVGKRDGGRIYWDYAWLGPAYERLARLYDESGDMDNAVKYYAMFTELWADADAELQPRVEAARGRLEEIVRERG